MNKMDIRVRDFSLTPGARKEEITPGLSGEKFRKEWLAPKFLEAIKNDSKLLVDLGGVRGYDPSFLEEIFGGLVRMCVKSEADYYDSTMDNVTFKDFDRIEYEKEDDVISDLKHVEDKFKAALEKHRDEIKSR